jgi:dTDP-4-dehydrorhamnose reductase
MLGHKVLQHLLDSGMEVGCTIHGSLRNPRTPGRQLFVRVPIVIEDWDAQRADAALERISEYEPAVVVNCVGVVKQREAAKQFIPSLRINALWPHLLAEAAGRWGGRVIHFSTDCVFDGTSGGYRETDRADADDLYGRTKLLGELTTPNGLTLRTSIIGRELSHFASLLEWVLAQKGSIKGFRRAWFSGVTTNQLAFFVRRLILDYPTLTGLFHVAGPRIAKYDLLCLIRDAFDLSIDVVPDDSFAIDRSLNGDQFLRVTGLTSPPWREMIAELAADTTPYREWQATN